MDEEQSIPRSRESISNEVLFEKISQLHRTSQENSNKIEKLSISVTQNFNSIAEVLRQGYVSKDELSAYKDIVSLKFSEVEKELVEHRGDISKRLHKDTFKPYAWALNAIAGAGLLSVATLFGKMLVDYIAGGPPQ